MAALSLDFDILDKGLESEVLAPREVYFLGVARMSSMLTLWVGGLNAIY